MKASALALTFSAIAMLGQSALVAADEWPKLSDGKWQVMERRDNERSVTTECINPIEKLRQAVAALDQAGCKRAALKRSGSTYRFDVSCEREDNEGRPVQMTGTFKLTVRGRESFQMEQNSKSGGVQRNVRADGKRLGSCE